MEDKEQEYVRTQWIKEFTKMQVAVERLQHHGEENKREWEDWMQRTTDRLRALEQLVPADIEGRLRALEDRPLARTREELQGLIDERDEIKTGRATIRLLMQGLGALVAAAIAAAVGYFIGKGH